SDLGVSERETERVYRERERGREREKTREKKGRSAPPLSSLSSFMCSVTEEKLKPCLADGFNEGKSVSCFMHGGVCVCVCVCVCAPQAAEPGQSQHGSHSLPPSQIHRYTLPLITPQS